jgi:hypothetical protein
LSDTKDVVAEDLDGYVRILFLNHFKSEDTTEGLEIGALLSIKEPTVKFGRRSVPFPDIQSPSDIVILHRDDPTFLGDTPFPKPHSVSALRLRAEVVSSRKSIGSECGITNAHLSLIRRVDFATGNLPTHSPVCITISKHISTQRLV